MDFLCGFKLDKYAQMISFWEVLIVNDYDFAKISRQKTENIAKNARFCEKCKVLKRNAKCCLIHFSRIRCSYNFRFYSLGLMEQKKRLKHFKKSTISSNLPSLQITSKIKQLQFSAFLNFSSY